MSTRLGALSPQSLEMLRGTLATYVLIGHARWLLWAGHAVWLQTAPPWWELPIGYGSAAFRFGREAVLVFFALSGFFIHLATLNSAKPLSAGEFYRRRVHRLAAPYYFALAVTVVCDAIGRWQFPMLYQGATGDALLDSTMRSSGFSGPSVIPALIMLPSSQQHDFGSNGPLWSLAYEVVYYAVYPFWAWLLVRNRLAALIGVPILCLAGWRWMPDAFTSSVVMWYPLWIGGAALAECVPAFAVNVRARAVAAGLGAAGFTLYLLANAALPRVIGALGFAMAAVYCFSTWPFPGVAPARLLAYLGTRSFSIYILHFPLLALVSAAQFQLAGARPVSGWLASGGAILAVVLSCAGFWVCERHFLHRRAWLSERAAP